MWKLFLRSLTTHVAETDDADSQPNLRPFTTDHPPQVVSDALHTVVSTRPLWEIISGAESAGDAPPGKTDGTWTVHLTHKTRGLGFIDDIKVWIEPRGVGSYVTAWSSSRVGVGDLGQNRRNLLELLGALRRRLTSPSHDDHECEPES